MYKFYIPLLYLFKTRLVNFQMRIAWIFTYLLPVAILFFMLSSSITFIQIAVFCTGILTIYTVYELGYIENDTETIKKESSPTLRLTEEELHYYENFKFKIYLFRFLLTLLFITFLWQVDVDNTIIFSFIILCLFFLFRIYNQVRNRFTLILQFFLSSIRYFSILIFPLGSSIEKQFVIFLFLFPLANIIEWSTYPKFKFSHMIQYQHKIHTFRIYYYLCIILIGLLFFRSNTYYDAYMVTASYFLVYRILTNTISKG